MLNLLSNALKFTNEGSVVVEVTQKGPEMVSISVEDTGCGIEKKHLKNLFKIFGKLEQTAIINETGTGLDLALSKMIVE